jgi:hypothetical protein
LVQFSAHNNIADFSTILNYGCIQHFLLVAVFFSLLLTHHETNKPVPASSDDIPNNAALCIV